MNFWLRVSGVFIAGWSLAAPPEYPVARKMDHVDQYFGTAVADPYRWLEDDRSA